MKTALDLTTYCQGSICLAVCSTSFRVRLKASFNDAVALLYGWPLWRTPFHCARGAAFSVDHAMSCPKGGLFPICHNKIRDFTAHQVQVEPKLQPVSDPDTFSNPTANFLEGA